METALAGQASGGRASNNAATLKSVEARMGRLRDLYESGDIAREEYLQRREALDCEVTSLRAASQQTLRVQRAEIRSLVDDWAEMGADQRKRLLSSVFEEILVGRDGVSELVPREGRRPYLKAALERPRILAERKTGDGPAIRALRTFRVRDGGLDLLRRAA